MTSEDREPDQDDARNSWPSREDVLAVMQASTWPCECPPIFSRLFAEVYAPYFRRHACKSCRARRALDEVRDASESL